MLQPYFLSFRTVAIADNTPPTILGISPATSATGVSRSSSINIGFSKDMDSSTINTSTITLSPSIIGTVLYNSDSRSATFSPTSLMAGNKSYTVTVVSGASGVKDVAGNQLASDYTSTFTTNSTTDNTPPIVVFAGADNFGVAV